MDLSITSTAEVLAPILQVIHGGENSPDHMRGSDGSLGVKGSPVISSHALREYKVTKITSD